MGVNSIPANERYESGILFGNSCNYNTSSVDKLINNNEKVITYPNPVQSKLIIESSHSIEKISVFDVFGKVIYFNEDKGLSKKINTVDWNNGLYFMLINFSNNKSITKTVFKANSF